MKSVIFFDIDGTISTEDSRCIIPESTRKAIIHTRKKGNLTFINTGRTAFNISPEVRSLGFDGFLCGCGTYIEYGNEVILHHTPEKTFCREIAGLMRECRVTPVYEHSDGYFFDDKAVHNAGLDYFMNVFVEKGTDISHKADDENFIFDKFVVWTNPESDMELFNREVSKYFSIIDRGNGFYENVPLGYTKATAIDIILEKLNISRKNAYAIGDSMNDLPMLKAVPNSIAMGGAEKLYPFVSYVTSGIEDDGIYNALKHFQLI
ncbi:MAG: Cof-type HAD-IIB family hydrolase [Prevotella sp.]|nr:Cof-type HAD-IIB family hydrolase [Alistipes senegalensis]MCM1358366.1 Cof-type HAD-IIB family hydrolase [Prevotella sp.]MCM1474066.1 Cof-type HAD-IIB family hydrolase [Muribaculaceae bacterium]